MGLPKRLTEMQKRFAEYIVFNEGRTTGADAAISAGYSEKRARVEASELQNPRLSPLVVQYIGSLREEKLKKFEVTDDRIKTVERLISVARDTGNRMKGTQYEHVTSLCTSMIRVASSISDSISHPDSKDVDLLKPMAEAIISAFNPDQSSSEMYNEINKAVESFKQKQQKKGSPL